MLYLVIYQQVCNANDCVHEELSVFITIFCFTGITVKCHQSRSLDQNRKMARTILLTKLDNLINGENSVEAQKRLVQNKRKNEYEKKQARIRELKKSWKAQQNSENENSDLKM